MRHPPNHLYTLIDDVVRRIDGLDPSAGSDVREFSRQLLEARADLFEQLAGDRLAPEARRAAELLASGMIEVIKEIPGIVEAMLGAIDRRTTEPAVRSALTGALAYLVQPRDLLPDDLPGGFGFIDDCMILRATVSEFIDFLPAGFTTIEKERRLLELLAIAIPPERLPEFQRAVESIWLIFHALLWETAEEADAIAERIMAAPLETPLPQPDRLSIPLPPGPRLSMEPGGETLDLDRALLSVTFAKGGEILIDEDGQITEWT
jgi:uncharacterized membrane protein YkvA (DUF1232 family)